MPQQVREEGAESAGAQPAAEVLATEGEAARTEGYLDAASQAQPAPEAEAPKAVELVAAESEAEDKPRPKRRPNFGALKDIFIELTNRTGAGLNSSGQEMQQKAARGEELREHLSDLSAALKVHEEQYRDADLQLSNLKGKLDAFNEAIEQLRDRPEGGIKASLAARLNEEDGRLKDLRTQLDGDGTETPTGFGLRKRLENAESEIKRLAAEVSEGKSGTSHVGSRMSVLETEREDLKKDIRQIEGDISAVNALIGDLKTMNGQKLDEEKDVKALQKQLTHECQEAEELTGNLKRQFEKTQSEFERWSKLLETNETEVGELRERLHFIKEVDAALRFAQELVDRAQAVLTRREKTGPRFAEIESTAEAALADIVRITASLHTEIDVALSKGQQGIIDHTSGTVKAVAGRLEVEWDQLDAFLVELAARLGTFGWDSSERRESRSGLDSLRKFCDGFSSAVEAADMNQPDVRGFARDLVGLIDGAKAGLAKRDPAVVAAELGGQIKALQNAGHEKAGLEAQNAGLRKELDQKQKVLERSQGDLRKANEALAAAQSKDKPAAPNGHGLELKQNALRALAAEIKDVLEGRKDRRQLLEQYSGQPTTQEMLQMIFAGQRDALVARRLVKMAGARSVADLLSVVQKLTGGVSPDGTVVVSGAASGEEEPARPEAAGAGKPNSIWSRLIRR